MSIRKVATFALGTLAVAMLPHTISAQQWSVGYWLGADSVPISSIQMNALTHIVFTSGQVQTDGSLVYKCSFGPCTESQLGTEATALITLAHSNGVKVLLGLDNVSGSQWSGCAGTNQSTCVTNIMQLVNAYGYDGIDIDWEQSINFTQLGSLITALRTQLGTRLLSMVANPAPSPVPANYASVAGPLDRVNVSVTDQGGNFNPYTWFNNPLFSDSNNNEWSVDLAKQRFVSAGIAVGKMNFGISFYGEVQTGAVGPRLADTVTAISQISYRDVLGTYPTFVGSPTIDSVAKVPWFSPDGSHWVTYNNPTSVTSFVNYNKTNSTGGWFLYSLEHDYIASATPTHPLMNAVALAEGGGTAHSATLQWKASTSAVSGYNLYRSSTAGGPYTKINASLIAGTTYSDPSIAFGQIYFFVARAVSSSAVEGGNSNEVETLLSLFLATPSTIAAGASSTLSWIPYPAGSAWNFSIDQGVGAVSGTSKPISPTATTLYTLTASNSSGSDQASALVTVGTLPVISSFTASPATVTPGSPNTLSWATTGATSLSINQGVGTVTGTSQVVNPTGTITYILTASNAVGSVTKSLTLWQLPVISSFASNPSSITSGSASSLSWMTSGATSLSINQGVGTVSGSSSVSVSPTTTTIYALSATNPGGTTTANATVTVAASVPAIASFIVNPTVLLSGNAATLSWSVTGATSLSIDNGVGTVTGTSVSVSPTSNTTYVLTATNSTGSATASLSVMVIPAVCH